MLVAIGFCAASQAHVLAEDGRCKTFDVSANGYVRAEGSGAVVLEPLASARAPLALLRGVAVNHDGRSASLTAPNGPAQQQVINAALGRAGAVAADVAFTDCHGTGTSLGDPIEMSALRAVQAAARDGANGLAVGAIKSSMGHLEGAAGMAGVLKGVLVLRHGSAPANLHLQRLNPHIDLDGFAAALPAQSTSHAGGALAGCSSFGFSGTNTHCVFGAPPANAAGPPPAAADLALPSSPPALFKRAAFPFSPQVSSLCGARCRRRRVARSSRLHSWPSPPADLRSHDRQRHRAARRCVDRMRSPAPPPAPVPALVHSPTPPSSVRSSSSRIRRQRCCAARPPEPTCKSVRSSRPSTATRSSSGADPLIASLLTASLVAPPEAVAST